MTKYYCKACKKTLLRASKKQWIKSYCMAAGKDVRITRVK